MTAQTDWKELVDVIRSAEGRGCVLGVVIAASCGRFAHNAGRPFVAASTVKIPIMIELFRQADEGRRSLHATYVLRDEDRAPGSGIMLHLHSGIEFTLSDMAYLMISISDNTATNVLIDLVGMDRVNATMRSLGMAGSTLGRKMLGRAATDGEQENWATADDYAGVIAAIFDGRAASPEACRRMIGLLERQQNDRRIARFLAKQGRPRWGSKTGSLAGMTNDVGFVETAGGPTIISTFCERPPDAHSGEEIIGEISRAALRAVALSRP